VVNLDLNIEPVPERVNSVMGHSSVKAAARLKKISPDKMTKDSSQNLKKG
jgi:hypothetical protein